MKNYEVVNPKDALRQALDDDTMEWTKYEKIALIRITEDDSNHGSLFGSRRFWNAKGSRIVFVTDDTETGYNVGVLKLKTY